MKISKYNISLWWFPPKGIRSLNFINKLYHDGEVYWCFCLFFVHIEIRRNAECKDLIDF